MIQLLFALLAAEAALALSLLFRTPARRLALLAVDRAKRGRGPVIAKTVAGTMLLVLASSGYSIDPPPRGRARSAHPHRPGGDARAPLSTPPFLLPLQRHLFHSPPSLPPPSWCRCHAPPTLPSPSRSAQGILASPTPWVSPRICIRSSLTSACFTLAMVVAWCPGVVFVCSPL